MATKGVVPVVLTRVDLDEAAEAVRSLTVLWEQSETLVSPATIQLSGGRTVKVTYDDNLKEHVVSEVEV